MISPKMEEARIQYALRRCREEGFELFEPMDLIQKAIDESENPSVSWSGGKCSTVVLHMALQLKPDITVFFNDTGVHFPETVAYVKEMAEKWDLNITRGKPDTTFWKIVEQYGFPHYRVMGFDKDSKKKAHVPKCCVMLKEKPFMQNVKRLNVDANITGIRLAESRARAFVIAQKGHFYFNKHYKLKVYHPIAFWNEQQVYDYLKSEGIPLNGVYEKGQRRSGCWPCTAFKSWAESLAGSHPKMYRFLAKKLGRPALDEYLTREINFEEQREKAILDSQCRQELIEEWF